MNALERRERVRREPQLWRLDEGRAAAFELGRHYEHGATIGSAPRLKRETRERRVLERGFALLDEDRTWGAHRAAALLMGYTDASNGVV